MMIQNLEKLSKKHPALLVELAYNRYKEGRNDKSLKILKKFLKKFPQDVSGLALKGLVLEEIGEYNEAKDVYRQAVEIDPRNIRALSRLARIQDFETPGDNRWKKELLEADPLSAFIRDATDSGETGVESVESYPEDEKALFAKIDADLTSLDEPETAFEAETEAVLSEETDSDIDRIGRGFEDIEKALEDAVSDDEPLVGTKGEPLSEDDKTLTLLEAELEASPDIESLREQKTADIIPDIEEEETPSEETFESPEDLETGEESITGETKTSDSLEDKEMKAPELKPMAKAISEPEAPSDAPDYSDVLLDAIPVAAEPQVEERITPEITIEVFESEEEGAEQAEAASEEEKIGFEAELDEYPLSSKTMVEEELKEDAARAVRVEDYQVLKRREPPPSKDKADDIDQLLEAELGPAKIGESVPVAARPEDEKLDTILKEVSALTGAESVRSIRAVNALRRDIRPVEEPAKNKGILFTPPLEEVKLSKFREPILAEPEKADSELASHPEFEELNKVFQEINDGFSKTASPSQKASEGGIRTTTLAEIYASQGDYKKALEVYGDLPEAERNRHTERIRELEIKLGLI